MPGKDLTRWTENEDGTWSRIVPDEYTESVEIGVNDLADPIETVAADVLVSATTGALEAAEKLGIDINTVAGTGKDGKVTKADVQAAAA